LSDQKVAGRWTARAIRRIGAIIMRLLGRGDPACSIKTRSK
jgi:hypothetical protein